MSVRRESQGVHPRAHARTAVWVCIGAMLLAVANATNECRAGTIMALPRRPASCLECAAGRYSGDGALVCALCPAGQFDDDGSPATPCAACPAGTFSPREATACEPCTPGLADLDQSSATPCEPCGAGRHSEEASVACTGCPAGAPPRGLRTHSSQHRAC
jgi:hypothetical protein